MHKLSGPVLEGNTSQNVLLYRPPVQSDVNRLCVRKGSIARCVENTKLNIEKQEFLPKDLGF
jgi:hypothetical protein